MDSNGNPLDEQYSTPRERVTPINVEHNPFESTYICAGTQLTGLGVPVRHGPSNPVVDRDGSSSASTLAKPSRRCCDPITGAWQNNLQTTKPNMTSDQRQLTAWWAVHVRLPPALTNIVADLEGDDLPTRRDWRRINRAWLAYQGMSPNDYTLNSNVATAVTAPQQTVSKEREAVGRRWP